MEFVISGKYFEMIKPTEIIGKSILSWDEFYSNNYSWIFNLIARESKTSDSNVRAEIEKMFIKLALSRPEIIVEGNSESIKMAVTRLKPELSELIQQDQIKAQQLIKKYYCQN